jgi:hypothetical protein
VAALVRLHRKQLQVLGEALEWLSHIPARRYDSLLQHSAPASFSDRLEAYESESSVMRRRTFITLLGGAAAAPAMLWPLAARAQQGERMRRIGVLSQLAADDAEWQSRLAGFLQTLQELGWTVGRNARIDYRLSADNAERVRRDVAELVALAPDVILANGPATVEHLLHATRTLPSSLCRSAILSAPDMLRAWRGPAGTPPASPSSSTA